MILTNYISNIGKNNIDNFNNKIMTTSIQGNNVLCNFHDAYYFGFHYAYFNSFKINTPSNSSTYLVNKGEFFISKNATDYSLESMSDTYTSIFTILVKASYWETIFKRKPSDNTVFRAFIENDNIPFLITNLTNTPKHETIELEEVINLFTSKESAPYLTNQLFLESLIKKIFIHINQYCISNKLEESYLITSVKKYISDNLATASLAATSEYLNYTAAYLSDYIKKETGQNFSEILVNMRMSKALELLNKSDDSLTEISRKTGYSQTSNFIKVFKSKYNVTPGEYKNNPTILN